MQHLFPDNFLAAISRLSIDLRSAPPRAAHGVHLSARVGSSLEFRDYQAYAPGDDLRRVDWNVYGRSKHLFIRRFQQPTVVPIYILVDASASMQLETPSRYTTAARLAAAIASAGLSSQNQVFLSISDAAGTTAPRAVTGRRGLVRVLAELAADRKPASTGIAAGLEALLPFLSRKGKGVLVLISDFFEDRGIEALTNILRLTPQRLVMMRVTQRWDADPHLQGDLELLDCETSNRLQVSMQDAEMLRQYRVAYQSYFAALDQFAHVCGAMQATVDASTDTLPQLERLFPGGGMSL
jgi:uncharacterized protein (DUF58 family)